MLLPHDLFLKEKEEVTGFDGHKLNPKGSVILIVSLTGKHMIVDFLLMKCNSLYNGILGWDWTVPMEVTSSARFQCIKFPNQDRVLKV